MDEKNFNKLVKSVKQAIEYAKGKRCSKKVDERSVNVGGEDKRVVVRRVQDDEHSNHPINKKTK
jgi:hypothetical protein